MSPLDDFPRNEVRWGTRITIINRSLLREVIGLCLWAVRIDNSF